MEGRVAPEHYHLTSGGAFHPAAMSPDPTPVSPVPRRRPAIPVLPVTGTIIALNVAVFVMMAAFLDAGWFETTSLAPYIRYGANNAAATTDGQWWRLLTCMFMHFGLLHLALNMWALLQAGSLVERLQGRILFALTYLASGIGGGLLSMDWHGDKMWSAGASGAIFGVYGALLGYVTRDRLALPRAVLQPLTKSTVLFACYNLIYGFVNPSIDNAAHIGGLSTGLALGWLTAPSPGEARSASAWRRRLAIGIVATAVIVATGVVLAPCYDYSVRDELAWQDAVKPFADRQAALEDEAAAGVQEWLRTQANGPALEQLIKEKVIPFFAGLGRAVGALDLSDNKATDRRRRQFAAYARIEAEAYRHLTLALQANNMSEFEAYASLRGQAEKAVNGSLPSSGPKR